MPFGLGSGFGHGLSMIGTRIRIDFNSVQNPDVIPECVIEAGAADPYQLNWNPD